MNRWVDPSFSDFSENSLSLPGRRKGSQVLCSKPEPKRQRKRKGEGESTDYQTSYVDQDEPWVDRYSPRSQVGFVDGDTCSAI